MTPGGPPLIQYGTTSSYTRLYRDRGLEGPYNIALYRPVAPDGWFILGDYAQSNHGVPAAESITITVTNDDPSNPVLAAPQSFTRIWSDRDSQGWYDGSLWIANPPPGYVALGAIANQGLDEPSVPQIRCMRLDLLQPTSFGPLIWSDRESHEPRPASLYGIVGISTFHAQADRRPAMGTPYIPAPLNQGG